MRRAIGDALVTGGGALMLVMALVLIDPRVRVQIGSVIDARHPGGTLTALGGRVGDVVAIVVMAAREQSLAHGPLVIFALVAVILTLFMLRI